MAKERRDSKNRLLGKGEYQKEDGRYMYRYTDTSGKARFVYSWTLTKSDRVPKGKPTGPCLRDLEKDIAKDLMDGIRGHEAKSLTYGEYFERYLATKSRLKKTTRRNYKYLYDAYIKETFGDRKIGDIRYSDVKLFYSGLLDQGKSLSVLKNIDVFFTPVFSMAVKDDHIRKNPAQGVYIELKKESDEMKSKKCALTISEQERFITFVKNHKRFNHWLPLFTFLLGTGCRIGEALGLTWSDCDFNNNLIHINHSLSYYPDEHTGKATWSILTPKTKAGTRDIPMFDDVRKALRNEYVRQMRDGFCSSEIDGYTGFVFVNRDRNVHMPGNINEAINRIVEDFNKTETKLADIENRAPNLLPRFTPHILRHTFCTRMCENDANLKVLQEVMGHGNITITMDVYADATKDSKLASFKALEGCFKIG